MCQVAKTVTFGVIAYNEQRYLPDLLADLLGQSYEKRLIEVILVDGDSSDDTWKIMEDFQRNHIRDYLDIKLFHNPKRIQPAGWNIVIRNSKADILLRIDAHARLTSDFIEKNVACINSGEDVCGGPRENIIDDDTSWKRVLLTAEQSMFGAGIASYRQDAEQRKYVNSLFHGAYKKEVLKKVGLFNEKLIRTEDNEFHYRIRKCGYNICYDPSIKSYYQTRNTLKGMIKQKYGNGYWIGKTLFVCPHCISVFHLVPFVFVLAILATACLSAFRLFLPAICLWISYGIVAIIMTVQAVLKIKLFQCVVLPFVFLLLHLSYGIGTLIGIIEIGIGKVRHG